MFNGLVVYLEKMRKRWGLTVVGPCDGYYKSLYSVDAKGVYEVV